MRLAALAAFALAACTPARPAMGAYARQDAVAVLGASVREAAALCPGPACRAALIPPTDALAFVDDTDESIGCAAKSVRVGLERVRDLLGDARMFSNDIAVASRVEPWALASCDPLRPTTSVTVYVDPNIANVQPEYPR